MFKRAAEDVLHAMRLALVGFLRHEGSRMAAALSFFATFSLAPLLILAMSVAGLFFESGQVRGQVEEDLQAFVGPGGIEQVRQMLATARQPQVRSLSSVLGLVALIWGASSALFHLQKALNEVWGVERTPGRSKLLAFLLKRLFSIAMVLALGLVLVISLVASTLARAFDKQLNELLPGGLYGWSPEMSNNAISFALLVFLFATIYKVLPDARVRWRDVGVGALLTAGFFLLGKFAVALYLGSTGLASSFGAAGSLALFLIWVFYSATVLLLGAEFTRAWADCREQRSTAQTT